MSYITVQVEIDHGKVIPREPEKLPVKGRGVLMVFASAPKAQRHRIALPLIQGDGARLINPTADDLDASLWD